MRKNPRLAKLVGRAQRGMTLLEIMIVLAILALIMGLVVGPRVMKMFSSSKVDTSRTAAKLLAFDAYPQWSMAHPGKQCPDNVNELVEYVNSAEALKDAWGNPFKFLCGATMPQGTKGVMVISPGEDGKDNTPDDIKSTDE